jgi:hypothetical protein
MEQPLEAMEVMFVKTKQRFVETWVTSAVSAYKFDKWQAAREMVRES